MIDNPTSEAIDPAVASQIAGLIEFRKSKLSRLESAYVKGAAKVKDMRNKVKNAQQDHIKFKERAYKQMEELTDTYLGGGYSPLDIQKWFAKERHIKDEIVTDQCRVIDLEQELGLLVRKNQQEKKAYQEAMIGCEKIQILKQELLYAAA